MGLFTKSSIPKSERLAKTSADALSVFSSTIAKLKEVVEFAKTEISSNKKEIESLQAENTKLEKVVADNTSMASKLSDLFNPPSSSSSSDGNE